MQALFIGTLLARAHRDKLILNIAVAIVYIAMIRLYIKVQFGAR